MAKMGSKLWIWTMIIFAAFSAGCNSDSSPETSVQSSPQAAGDQILRVYNWDTYIDPDMLTDFEQKFNVDIEYMVFDSDDDVVSELEAGATDQYDLIVPSDFNVSVLRSERLLAPLDKENIPNFSNIDPIFVSPVFDPANRYCVPYQWGTVGIGYNIDATGDEIVSWADFFDPAFAGRVAMLDDDRTTMGIILILLGYSPNTTNAGEISEAAEFMKNQREQGLAIAGDESQDLLLDGTYDMVLEWSGDIFQLMEEHSNIRYTIPAEGSIIWVDNICIPADAPNKAMAEQFINYLLEPEVGAALSNFVQYGTPNQASLPFINEEDLNNPAIYPPDSVRDRLFFLVDVNLAAAEIYNQAWEEILTHQES